MSGVESHSLQEFTCMSFERYCNSISSTFRLYSLLPSLPPSLSPAGTSSGLPGCSQGRSSCQFYWCPSAVPEISCCSSSSPPVQEACLAGSPPQPRPDTNTVTLSTCRQLHPPHTHIHVPTCIHTCTCIYIHCTFVHAHIHIYIYVYMYVLRFLGICCVI